MWCTPVYLKVPLVALVSASWVNAVQKNPRYHHLNVVTSSPLSGRASAPWMEPGECGAWLEGLVALPVVTPQKREKLRRVPTMHRFRPRNCWSSRSTQWPSTTGALAPWLSSASRASVLSSPTGSLCNGEWETMALGQGQEGLLKEEVCPSVFVMSVYLFASHWALPGWVWHIWGLCYKTKVLLGPCVWAVQAPKT